MFDVFLGDKLIVSKGSLPADMGRDRKGIPDAADAVEAVRLAASRT